MAKSTKSKTMLEVTKGYENFIANKKVNKVSKVIFEKVIKKTVETKKQLDSTQD